MTLTAYFYIQTHLLSIYSDFSRRLLKHILLVTIGLIVLKKVIAQMILHTRFVLVCIRLASEIWRWQFSLERWKSAKLKIQRARDAANISRETVYNHLLIANFHGICESNVKFGFHGYWDRLSEPRVISFPSDVKEIS